MRAVNGERQASSVNGRRVCVGVGGRVKTEHGGVGVQVLLRRELLSGRWRCAANQTQTDAQVRDDKLVVQFQQVLRDQGAGHLTALQIELIRRKIGQHGFGAQVGLAEVFIRNPQAFLNKLLFTYN